jgi:signal transduction histidine kinase
MGIANSTVASKILAWIDRSSGYVLAFAATCTATGVRFAMQQELQERNRMLLFIPAVLVSAWYGGVGPGIFSLLFGTFMCAWILIPPVTNINLGDRVEQVGMLLYLAVGAGVIVLAHRERCEKERREAAQRELERLNQSLEERVRDRTKELEFANRELEGFCYNVSHDLRTPSRAIAGNIHILIEDYGNNLDTPIKDRLDRISLAAVKLGNLVDALLVYARLAKADLSHENVDIGQIIDSQADFWAKNLGVAVKVDRPQELVVTGDRTHLSTAISALVCNSALYRQPGKECHLTVTFIREGTDAIVTFSDDGIGFDTQYLHKIFLPFERLHRDSEYPGVGMGLATVSRIAERHGGKITADATPGEGATFSLRLGNQISMPAPVKQLVRV